MAYKILAIDMDDTLLNDDLIISDKNKKALAVAHEAGVKIVISTGRTYLSVLPYLKELNLEGVAITYNGALVKQIKGNKTLHHHPVPYASAKKIYDLVQSKDLHFNIYLDGKIYANKGGAEAKEYERISGITVNHYQGDIEQMLARESTKIVVIENDLNRVDSLLTEFKKELEEELNIFTSKPNFIEFLQQGVSKGSALKQVASQFKVTRDEVLAIGDSYNDLEMLEYAGLGVAMGNAREDIKEAADYVTATNNQSGVARVVEKYIR